MDSNKASSSNQTQSEPIYFTDEEEIERETDWIIKTNKRKWKSLSSPATPVGNISNQTTEQKQADVLNLKSIKESYAKKHTPHSIIVSGIVIFGELKNMIQQLRNENTHLASIMCGQ